MMDKNLMDFIPFLQCPATGKNLKVAPLSKIRELNARSGLKHLDGNEVNLPLRDALWVEEYDIFYPVDQEKFACLLETSGIYLLSEFNRDLKIDHDKLQLQNFYDEVGWQKKEGEQFSDTAYFEDNRKVASKYWEKCDARITNYLSGGEYLLDIASGAISHPEYLNYSKNYKFRICIDFSISALVEAEKKIKNGIFILGDMTKIPIKSGVVASVVSMHTLYHVPRNEQEKAIDEVHRVLKPSGEALVVYSWKNPSMIKLIFKIHRALLSIYKKLHGRKKRENQQSSKAPPRLFVQQQDYEWFSRKIKPNYPVRLKVFSSISRSFSFTFIHNNFTGRWLIQLLFWLENAFPSLMARYGQYPLFIIRKDGKVN